MNASRFDEGIAQMTWALSEKRTCIAIVER